ncbi:transposable element Tc1 transposase [Trichonephila clavipes]|nr:transposable element Tc1 transposase [Trichonephila clavipes]
MAIVATPVMVANLRSALLRRIVLSSGTIKDCGSPVVKVSDHGRHVMSSSPVPLKTHRMGQRCTLNLSRAHTSSRWCGVVVRRGGVSSASPPPVESSGSEIEDEVAGKSNPTAVSTSKNRIPPIFVNPPDNWCTLISITRQLAPTLISKLTGKFLRITVQSDDEYRKLAQLLRHEGVENLHFKSIFGQILQCINESVDIHWCAKIKDEVEKLAYQLNEEAERTERPIRRLSKTTSGCFYPRSNHWEVGGRPQCNKCGCRVRNWSQHRFTTLETISNYRNSYQGFSSGRPRGTTPADDRYIVLQARRNRRQTAGEIARHMTQATGRPISRFTVARRLHGGGLFARRPVRCVPSTPAHRRRHESRFSLSSDSHRILIWRERGSRNHPSNIIERDRYGGRGVLVWGGIMLGSRTDLHIFDAGSVNGTRYCNEILLPYVRLFRGAMGLQFLFMDDNAPCHRTVAAEQLLESEDIERMDWPARSPDLNPIEHVWDFLGRRLAARALPPVTIREL